MTSAHQLLITLADVSPPVRRRVVVPSDLSLSHVHRVLVAAMGWGGGHLYALHVGDATYMDDDGELEPDERDAAAAKLGDVAAEGDRLVHDYDFGDGWRHEILVEAVTVDSGPAKPRCLSGENACPPEDVGGPSGYADFVAVLSDPAHSEHADVLDWAGGAFDPRAFDLAATNRRLARLRLR